MNGYYKSKNKSFKWELIDGVRMNVKNENKFMLWEKTVENKWINGQSGNEWMDNEWCENGYELM